MRHTGCNTNYFYDRKRSQIFGDHIWSPYDYWVARPYGALLQKKAFDKISIIYIIARDNGNVFVRYKDPNSNHKGSFFVREYKMGLVYII